DGIRDLIVTGVQTCALPIFVNDAALQARGSYQGGKMLFLGLGTGLGSTLIVEGIVEPMELGHLPYRDGTFETYVGLRGLQEHGRSEERRVGKEGRCGGAGER